MNNLSLSCPTFTQTASLLLSVEAKEENEYSHKSARTAMNSQRSPAFSGILSGAAVISAWNFIRRESALSFRYSRTASMAVTPVTGRCLPRASYSDRASERSEDISSRELAASAARMLSAAFHPSCTDCLTDITTDGMSLLSLCISFPRRSLTALRFLK